DLINLGEPIMRENYLCPILDRLKLPGDTSPGPLRHAAEPVNPAHFLVLLQFCHLNSQNKIPPLPKAKLSKRTHLWSRIQIVCPPMTYFLRLRQGSPDAPWSCFYRDIFDNLCHRCSFPYNHR